MIAIDTNLVVRYLIGDDSPQTLRAREIINGNSVFVAITVLLEVEWVLKSSYGLDRPSRCKAMRDFAGLPTVTIEDANMAGSALDLFAKGTDFADALHVLRSQHCSSFVTFDQKLVKSANAAGHEEVRHA